MACVLFGMLDVVADVVVNDGDSVSVTVVACVATVVPIVVSALLGCVVGLNVVASGGAWVVAFTVVVVVGAFVVNCIVGFSLVLVIVVVVGAVVVVADVVEASGVLLVGMITEDDIV